jgi:trk system potassium uptake protein TrkA
MKQFVAVGLGRFGASIATTLAENGHDVLAIDRDPEKVQAINADVTHAVEADATDEEALKTLGVRNFDVNVTAIKRGEQLYISPGADYKIMDGDKLK